MWTGFIYACDNNSCDVVELLLQYNNLINFNYQSVSGKTGFITACYKKNFKLVQLFLQCYHSEVNLYLTDSSGKTGYDYLITSSTVSNHEHMLIILELAGKMFSDLNEKIINIDTYYSKLHQPKTEQSYFDGIKQTFYKFFN